MRPEFLNDSLQKADALDGSYSPILVLASYLIASLAAFCALTIARQNLGQKQNERPPVLWHLIGSVTMGIGIWSMHFTGMIAFQLPLPVEYHPGMTALSALPAIFASWIVLRLISSKQLQTRPLIIGGVLMGAGIGSMHYSGMAGMKINAMMFYDPAIFALSVIVAIALSIVSLYTTFKLSRVTTYPETVTRTFGALIMGAAVGTMHYTGMAATYYFDICANPVPIEGYNPITFGGIVILANLLVIGFTTVAGVLDFNYRAATDHASKSQAILSRVLESTRQGYLRLDRDGKATEVNAALCSILGREKSELVGANPSEFLPLEQFESNRPIFETLATGRYEINLEHKSGKHIPCLYHATELKDRNGNPDGLVGLITDITELREREAKSQEHAENIGSLLDSLSVGVLLIDDSGCIKLFNESCEQMFGFNRDDLIGEQAETLICQKNRPEFENYISPSTPRISRSHTIELLAQRKDGSSFPIEFGANEVIIDCQIMLACAILDITVRIQEQKRRRELENEITQTSKLEAVGQLAGGIAHEINTPIQFVGDNLAYLETEFETIIPLLSKLNQSVNQDSAKKPTELDASALQELLEPIDFEFILSDIPLAIEQSRSGVKDVSQIILAMKEFSHPSAEQKESYNLARAIENTITISKSEWKNHAEIELKIAEDLPEIRCAPGAINQVLLNIVVNAAHAIEAARTDTLGTITVRAFHENDTACIHISDTGTGISEEHKSKIFDPFFTTKDVGKGTGQGLAIAWDIVVKKHRGTLEVESSEGVGTTFKIHLPVNSKKTAARIKS